MFNSMIEDKLEGFGTGADDYITKPFSLEELLCRIEVFLRRAPLISHIEQKIVFLGQYEFDFSNLTLKTRSAEKTLTQKEAEVLKLLYQNCERVLKCEEILKQVWGDDDYFMGRSMDVFISKLRKYVKEARSLQHSAHSSQLTASLVQSCCQLNAVCCQLFCLRKKLFFLL